MLSIAISLSLSLSLSLSYVSPVCEELEDPFTFLAEVRANLEEITTVTTTWFVPSGRYTQKVRETIEELQEKLAILVSKLTAELNKDLEDINDGAVTQDELGEVNTLHSQLQEVTDELTSPKKRMKTRNVANDIDGVDEETPLDVEAASSSVYA